MWKRIKRIFAGVGIVLIVLVAVLLIKANQWSEKSARRLAEGSQLIETSRGIIEYVEYGSGPVILTLHGAPGGYDGGGDGELWVEKGFRYVSPSRPGYLRTPIETGRTPEEQADAFAALLDALGAEKAVVIASSGGGPAGLQFALRHPDRCQGLVLISAITQPRPFTEAERAIIGIESSDLGSWLMMKLITDKPEWIFPAVAPELEPTGDPEQYEPYIEVAVATLPLGIRRDGWINDFEQMSQMPLYPLEQINCPTLIIHGAGDTSAPLANAELAATAIPNAEFIKLEEGSHLASLVYEEEVTPRIAEFIEDHSLGR